MLALLYLAMLALWLAGARRTRREAPLPADGEANAPFGTTLLAGLLVAALFVLELVVVEAGARQQQPFPDWFARLPLLPIDDKRPFFAHTAEWITDCVLALAVAQSAALVLICRALRGRRLPLSGSVTLGACCALMLGAALFTKSLTSFDLYAYVGSAHLGDAAYRPPAIRFDGPFALVNDIDGVPIRPAAYGPLWLALARSVTATAGSLGGQLQALRILGAALFVVSLALLRAARFDTATVALFALNPALIEQYVANGHNDIAPFALTLAALVAVRRLPWLAIVLAAAAGAMKLPFIAIAALAFVTVGDRRRRVGYAALAAAGALLLSGVLGGQAYLDALHRTSQLYRPPLAFPVVILYLATIAAALFATALALWRRRYIPTASWSFTALASVLFPWYLIWGLPYALAERRAAWIFLASLPVAAFVLSKVYRPTVPFDALVAAIVCIPVLMAFREKRAVAVPR
ncbi:MAG: hypothetical protein WAJ85_00295 [Candidatus Baltobacteraceae bacterium]|jgi:hypothetical protein